MQRNPSHFGSYCHSSPIGISSTERASIGGNGGFKVISCTYAARASADAFLFERRRRRERNSVRSDRRRNGGAIPRGSCRRVRQSRLENKGAGRSAREERRRTWRWRCSPGE